MAKRAPTRPADPDYQDLEDALKYICYYLPPIIAAVPISYEQLMKLKATIRDGPEKIQALLLEKILPFIDALPDLDKTVVGAEVGAEMVCLGCLAAEERAAFDDEEIDISAMTREEVTEFPVDCDRCGKPL